MLKKSVRFALLVAPLATVAQAVPSAPAILGPHANECEAGSGKNGMLVKIVGIKGSAGTVRVQSYGGDPAAYFDKGTYLERIDVPPAARTIEVCMIVPKPGTYAVSVRHAAGGTFSMSDGAGFSGNPNMSLMDAMFKRKPPAGEVQVKVNGITHVSVTMNYVEGGQLKPIALSSVPLSE